MKPVYTLAEALAQDPARGAKTQALTLDSSRPHMGLKGRHGLFASVAWWESIKAGRIQTQTLTGCIERTYFAGQDSRRGDQVNSFTLRLTDGSTVDESIYTHRKQDIKLFVPGATVTMVYALDEMKAQAADGGACYARIVLEVSVSAS
ncbi:hypothetical protein JAB5_56120 [Janthinobacterium sp. HH103]|uniref:hypothetical protein n=1 Tax=unclassified Janthinobacterium TaxID=2610881 RepID=UPI000874A9E7|nr:MULTISPECIES: hypothetical protein [unclassified Janthinobacterium]OEZ66541.1 hypothetical protein JAB5_56120 [Janthinobacterium sp. HH103]OEZ69487.1 hypothetical protein JAB2_12280 [Janthinobacterium sp. HH100]QOU72531.1 hypothetical protein JAB4_019670 [Janthinobacterium sp. HH102]